MNILDIITLAAFAAAVIICVWKGFIKILLKLGALVLAALFAKIFGSAVGELWFSDLIGSSGGKMTSDILDTVNDFLATVIGTVIVFVIFYIVLRIIFSVVSKIVKKSNGVSKADRILGALFGLVMAFGFMFVFSEIVRITVTVAMLIDPDTSIIYAIEDTVVFKYFF